MRVKRYRVDEAWILNPGNLRHQITWQSKVVSGQDANGQDIYTLDSFLTCKADVKSLAGTELEIAQQRFALANYKIIQHYYVGVTDKMQVAWFVDGATKLLDVLDISDPPGIQRYQVILAKDYSGT